VNSEPLLYKSSNYHFSEKRVPGIKVFDCHNKNLVCQPAPSWKLEEKKKLPWIPSRSIIHTTPGLDFCSTLTLYSFKCQKFDFDSLQNFRLTPDYLRIIVRRYAYFYWFLV